MKKIFFTLFLSGLGALAPFSTDVYLPAMPEMTRYFNTDFSTMQLTLSLFWVSFAFGQLAWGPLSDMFGRKKMIFIGVTVFIISSLACAFAQSIEFLIFTRIIQGLSACSGMVISMAIVKDSYKDEDEMGFVISRVWLIMTLAPMIAPTIGSFILLFFDWQANFYFLAFYGIVIFIVSFFIKESHPAYKREKLSLKPLANSYIEQLKCKPYLLAALALGCTSGTVACFVATSSMVYIDIYHVTPHFYGLLYAWNCAALILGNFFMPKVSRSLGEIKTIILACGISFLGLFASYIGLTLSPRSVVTLALTISIITLGLGILMPLITKMIFRHVVKYSGLASALFGSMRFFILGFTSTLISFFISKSAYPMIIGMNIMILFIISFLYLYFQTLKRVN